MTPDEKLAHSLKMHFGLAPAEPTMFQLLSIKAAIPRVRQAGRQPTEKDWHDAVAAVCPGMGHHKYSGIDNSDLNTLLALAIQAAGGGS